MNKRYSSTFSQKFLTRILLVVGISASFFSFNYAANSSAAREIHADRIETPEKVITKAEQTAIFSTQPKTSPASTTPKITSLSLIDELKKKKQTGSTILSICGYVRASKDTMPQLYSLVENVAKRLKIPVPLVLVFKGNVFSYLAEQIGIDFRCNAFATSLNQGLAFTCIGEDLINKGLSVKEIEAIIAHELSHIKYYHIIKRAALAFLISIILNTIIRDGQNIPLVTADISIPIIGKDFALAVYLKKIITILATSFYSRTNEKEADLSAASVINNPDDLTNGLYKIKLIHEEKPRLITWFKSLFETHPMNKTRKEYLTKYKQNVEAAKKTMTTIIR